MDGHSKGKLSRRLWEVGFMRIETEARRETLVSRTVLLVCAYVLLPILARGQSPEANVSRITASAPFKTAQEFLNNDYDRIVREIIQLTEIEAPPFKEEKRGSAYMEMLKQH